MVSRDTNTANSSGGRYRREWAAVVILLTLASNGCAVMMASKAPDRRNLSVLSPGVSRSQVVAELGPPLQSRQDQDGPKDVFAFKQGYGKTTKFGRAVFHGAADFSTLFLWELAGMPLEMAFDGEDVKAEVAYDETEHVRRVEFFQGAHLAQGQMTLAPWLRGSKTRQVAVVERSDYQPPQESSPQTASAPRSVK